MASVVATPNPIHLGEQTKIEGTGFSLDSTVSVAVDGEEVGTAPTRPSPEGGVADFYATFNEVGEFEVEMSEPGRGGEKASCDVEVLGQYPPAAAEAREAKQEQEQKEAKKEAKKEDEAPKRGTQTPQFRSRK